VIDVPEFVDTTLFEPARRRKCPEEFEFIRDLFVAQNPALDFALLLCKILPSKKLRSCSLNQPSIYLCRFEAFPLSILQAMASGCVITGFAGQGILANAAIGFGATMSLLQ